MLAREYYTLKSCSCHSAQKNSVIQNAQVSRYDLVFENGAGRDVDSFALIGYDDNGSLYTINDNLISEELQGNILTDE